jgi:7-cyano-7-deazaguanine synthase
MIRVLLSGGMDSAVCLAWAKKHKLPIGDTYDSELDFVDSVGFHYGQRHAKELEAARRIARACGVRYRVMPILDGIGESSLTGGDGELKGADVVVPNRNMRFLEGAALMRPFPDAIVIGSCKDDQADFEDCRPEFFQEAEERLGIKILTPLIDKTKAEVAALAHRLGAINLVIMSWSCYAGGEHPCGKCGACVARAAGLRDARAKIGGVQ